MRAFAFVVAMSTFACADGPGVIGIRVEDGAPSWLSDALDKAAAFWAEPEHHSVILDIGGNDILVYVDDEAWSYFPGPTHSVGDPVNRYNWTPFGYGDISMDTLTNTKKDGTVPDHALKQTSCILAHEIGHAVGMTHVDSDVPDLMSNGYEEPDGPGCSWSAADEEAFCRFWKCD